MVNIEEGRRLAFVEAKEPFLNTIDHADEKRQGLSLLCIRNRRDCALRLEQILTETNTSDWANLYEH